MTTFLVTLIITLTNKVAVSYTQLGEVSPKSIAKESPEKFSMFSAPILNFMAVLLTPLNFLLKQWNLSLIHIYYGLGFKCVLFTVRRNACGESTFHIGFQVQPAHSDAGIAGYHYTAFVPWYRQGFFSHIAFSEKQAAGIGKKPVSYTHLSRISGLTDAE